MPKVILLLLLIERRWECLVNGILLCKLLMKKIKSGNWNGEDLNVVWQPLKPFVYSQISKISGSSVMDELKVPVQNKKQ